MAKSKYVSFGGFTLLIEDIKLITESWDESIKEYKITIDTKSDGERYLETYASEYQKDSTLQRLHKTLGCESERDQYYYLRCSVYELREEIMMMKKLFKSLIQSVNRSMKKE